MGHITAHASNARHLGRAAADPAAGRHGWPAARRWNSRSTNTRWARGGGSGWALWPPPGGAGRRGSVFMGAPQGLGSRRQHGAGVHWAGSSTGSSSASGRFHDQAQFGVALHGQAAAEETGCRVLLRWANSVKSWALALMVSPARWARWPCRQGAAGRKALAVPGAKSKATRASRTSMRSCGAAAGQHVGGQVARQGQVQLR